MIYCEETVNILLKNYLDGRDKKTAIEEIKGTISNERLWLKGASSKEEKAMHEENITNLSECLNRLTA